ncbi:MAG TPA: hypothetical protein VNJ08_02695 [Bacteriovoracaceae bacterium]|nr:hypothetical protein [Bacteriovoracaceae bacterium]
MAKVVLSREGAKRFVKTIDVLTYEDKVALRYWITFVERNGIREAQAEVSFRDHELNGKWLGYRSASFGFSARIIYQVIDLHIEIVEIERITTNHDYER